MSTPAAFVTPELELGDPIVKKLLRSYSGVPVLDKSRHVIGVLSHKDISAVEVLEKSKVKDVMSKPAHVVTSGANLAQVWAEMLQWKVWRLPVVDPVSKQLVGVLCRSDILTPILNTAEDIRTHGEEVEREEHMGMLKDEKDEEDAFADDEGSAEFFSADADADVVDDADDDNGEPYSRTP
jgi:predicted transcriptional regulator